MPEKKQKKTRSLSLLTELQTCAETFSQFSLHMETKTGCTICCWKKPRLLAKVKSFLCQ